MRQLFIRKASSRGAALIIALAIMVLVLALVVGILSRVSSERSSAGGYASSVGAKLLGDTAVQLVQAQIDSATSGTVSVAWSSQPGVVRTFDRSGRPERSFKLYSDSDMQVSGALVPATASASLASWYQSPAIFTDLNMPVDTNFDGTADAWPILDPSAMGVVEGFSISGAPQGKYLGIQNTVPMPVRWLYVLQDGAVVAAAGSGTAATVTGATKENPIVGRIAFWTDDETCKININTASEGTYWDTPKAKSQFEENFGVYQPAKNEFQSYPGHPASTSLSPVFPDLTRDQIFSLVPRLKNEGSKNATVNVSAAKAIGMDQDRLFVTEDETLFSSTRSPNPGLTRNVLERSRFFITTTSRAPETNIFNLPRIATWPLSINTTNDYRTAFDRLIAFCATLNGYPYYFQRKNPDSTTADYDEIQRNRELFKYLQTLAGRAIPGFGGNFADKYAEDTDQVFAEIFDYIRCTNLADGNLARDKWYAGGTRLNGSAGGYFGYGQVLPIQIGSGTNAPRGFGRVPIITEVGLWLICSGDPKQVVPVDPTNPSVTVDTADSALNKSLVSGTTGRLKFDDVAKTKEIRVEAALVFEPFVPLAGYKGLHPDLEVVISGLQNFQILGNVGSPLAQPLGLPSEAEQTSSNKGRYLMSMNLVNASGLFPRAGHTGVWSSLGSRGIRARNSGRLTEDSKFNTTNGGQGSIKNQQYPFVGEPVTVEVTQNSPSVTIVGGNIEIKLIHRPSGKLLQTYNLKFPGGPFPAPVLRKKVITTATDPNKGKVDHMWSFQSSGNFSGFEGRFDNTAGFTFQEYDFSPSSPGLSDIVRTIVPVSRTGGVQSADFRILAMQDTISEDEFEKHPLFDSPAALSRSANSFVQQNEGWYYLYSRRIGDYKSTVDALGGTVTNLAANTDHYGQHAHPDTPYPANKAQATGDWDNGLADDIDGSYLNKPDEGVTYNSLDINTNYVPYFKSYQKEDFDSTNFFSPNRMIPSSGMFGSLPTGVKRNRHWETLLFRRQPDHPNYPVPAGNFINNPDYLIMDLFWMPVVEPYAVSEPLSTAGKINLNQQIVPFTWIQRNTGLYGVLKNEKVVSIPNSDVAVYKSAGTSDYRRPINLAETVKQLQYRFNNGDGTGLYAFRAAAEICDQHIIPDDADVSASSSKAQLDNAMRDYWGTHSLTGDNSRERIYTTVYPRLTTKSNTYTVYYRAQSLKKRTGSDPTVWDDEKDTVTGDYRGATTLERYVDPNANIPDYAKDPDAKPVLDSLYKWRMRAHRPFAP